MKRILPLITILLFAFVIPVSAQTLIEYFDVDITAFIDIDGYSSLELDPATTEIGIPVDVDIQIVDRFASPLANHEIVLFVENNSPSVTFTQPANTAASGETTGTATSSSTGAFNIRAYDTTYAQDILIQDSDTMYVFPVPTPELQTEPYYTKGEDNTVHWSEVTGISTYEYLVEVGLDEQFNNVIVDSGWVNTIKDTFENLNSATMYFYRIRARNAYGALSAWSTPVFSVQDSKAPIITYGSVEFLVGSSELINGVEVKFDVTDDLDLKNVVIYCQRSNGDLNDCGPLEVSGTSYTAYIPIDELERNTFLSLLEDYTFCVTATDAAGNTAKDCSFKIEVDEFIHAQDPIVNNVVNTLIGWMNGMFNYSAGGFNAMLDGFEIGGLQLFVISLLLLFFIVTMGLFAEGVLSIPYYIGFGLSRILVWLGLKKGGSALGMVYDALTKEPIKFVLYKVYDKNDSLVKTGFTDAQGGVHGDLNTGKYRVILYKSHYLYPSELVKGQKDGLIKNLYHGEFINVSSKHPMNVSIPMDPMDLYKDERTRIISYRKFTHFMKSVSLLILVVGLAGAVRLYERENTDFNFFMLILFVPAIMVLVRNLVKIKIDVPEIDN